ncbi:hypothetical protein HA44_07510 [Mixta gaviniae]|nr:hypothetical protein HA44_07510 [Mixta gaviniae]
MRYLRQPLTRDSGDAYRRDAAYRHPAAGGISGEAAWCCQQAQQWRAALAGEWITLSEADDLPEAQPPGVLRNLLGQEFRHAIF